jgi:hypothetical protein
MSQEQYIQLNMQNSKGIIALDFNTLSEFETKANELYDNNYRVVGFSVYNYFGFVHAVFQLVS